MDATWPWSWSSLEPYPNLILTLHLDLCHLVFKGQCHEIFCFTGFFHATSSPKPLKIILGSFGFLSKIDGDISESRCTTGINDTNGAPWPANISTNFWKNRNGPYGITRSLGETDSWKTWSRKSRGSVPLILTMAVNLFPTPTLTQTLAPILTPT